MDVMTTAQSDVLAAGPKVKPAVPKKPLNLTSENDVIRTTHVRNMIRKLQEKEQSNGNTKPNFIRKLNKSPAVPEKEEMGAQASNQTLEDLKAIDEDIEKLRKQIEERDKIISALREAAEAKDKKLDNLMLEYSKLQSSGKLDLDTSPESNRATSSSPTSPPLCNGELCWTDSFVNKHYHEPVYAQLLNDHTALQKVYNDLRSKLESKGNELERLKAEEESRKTDEGNKTDGGENAINLIMAEQIRVLKEREAQLIWEAEELREQNDLMEFRILELEECRKEFLDKEMMNEGKHRSEKIVWRERDIEEISDSGVMSLPTSEDLTSDSELGEAIRNYSPLGAATHVGVTTPENSHQDSGINDLKLKKSLKSAECLQESGIFVDSESSSDCAISSGTQSKACQTESVLDKTLLDIIDSSCDLFLSKNPGYLEDSKSDDLSTEISKLSVIQKKIQQKTNSPTPRSPHSVVSCPHSNSVLFYEERLSQLEDKLKIYESSGDTKDILLAKRLQKEVELAHRVKELTDKVTSLEAINRKLEEEKCEFEEAENDSRFQCQRLEIRLQELIDKNTELEVELERQKVIMNEERRREKKKGSLEGLLTKYEQRNFELEEKEIEAKQRLSMIEAAMPAIVAYNMYKMVQSPDFASILPATDETPLKDQKAQVSDPLVFQRLEEVLNDQKQLRNDYTKVAETAADRENALRKKIEELEAKADKDRELLEEMTLSLKAFKAAEKSEQELSAAGADDLFGELKQMVANEIQLRAQIDRLEKKELAYMQSLEKADEIWAGMEAEYKRRLKESEDSNHDLQKRLMHLETVQVDLQKALAEQRFTNADSIKAQNEVQLKIQSLISENEKLKAELSRNSLAFEENKSHAPVQELLKRDSCTINEENILLLMKQLELAKKELLWEREKGEKLKKDLEEKTLSVTSVETNLQGQISELTQELTKKSKELTSLEVTVSELREEVETLENKVEELVGTITMIKNQEEVSLTPMASSNLPQKPVEEKLCYVSVKTQNPFAWTKAPEQSAPAAAEPPAAANQISVKKEKRPPEIKVMIPNRFWLRFWVFKLPSAPRQELIYAYPNLKAAKEILIVKFHLNGFKTEVLVDTIDEEEEEKREVVKEKVEGEREESKEDEDRRLEEIFQLSIKNTELQQTLEKMEEESKLKDKEFEELLKIVEDIRREQESIHTQYHKIGKNKCKPNQEKPKKPKEDATSKCSCSKDRRDDEKAQKEATKSLDILQFITPIVVKTSEEVSTTLSSLQIAIDNLQGKHRTKSFAMKPLLDELNQKGDNREIEDLTKHLAIEFSSEADQEKKEFEDRSSGLMLQCVGDCRGEDLCQEKAPTSGRLCRSSPPSHSAFVPSTSSASLISTTRLYSHRNIGIDADFDFVAPITTLRKIGDDGVFIEWDVSHQPPTVIGFEVKVNGLLSHRVRSSSRNKALLRPLNLKDKISIQVFAISENGRSTKSSHATYPSEHLILNKATSEI